MTKGAKEALDLAKLGVGDLVREMSEAAVEIRYYASMGDADLVHSDAQRRAWTKHTERVQQELNRRFTERKTPASNVTARPEWRSYLQNSREEAALMPGRLVPILFDVLTKLGEILFDHIEKKS